MDYKTYLETATKLIETRTEQRVGQILMNVLRDANIELYVEITGTDLDVFYVQDDARLVKFFEVVYNVLG